MPNSRLHAAACMPGTAPTRARRIHHAMAARLSGWHVQLLCLAGLLLPLPALAQACIIQAESARMEVQVCQQNRSIPPNLFKSGFCKPQLAGQKTTVTFADRCPAGAFGVCRNAQTGGMPYQQDIYYYGIASDARFLKPACERQSKGVWLSQ